ncbi:hypothetical protein LXL04_027339 [Taraxacum kok-saghyz]
MPLVRVEVRNEYGLGMPELYTETDREDPKAVLDGVAVAGLVGILRQLGDLAEFAAEVFHGLQEQVLITSSRSHKLVERVYNIEAALPPLEKAILAQRSHLHFAYTAGSHWHTRLRTEQNHFIYSDLPRCIMDSYEDCRDPPRLHKLDKYDIGGPGSCFKRYSDPTYFKRTSSSSPYETHLQNVPKEKKARRYKKKKSSRYRNLTHEAPVTTHAGSMDFGFSNVVEKASPSPDISKFNVPQTSGIDPEIDHLTSFESRNGSGYIDCIFRPSYSTQSEDNINLKEPSSDYRHNSYHNSPSIDDNNGVPDENINCSNSRSHITWDEKLEIIDSTGRPSETIETEQKDDCIDFGFHDEPPVSTPVAARGQHDEIESETDYYLDALNTIESESETDIDCQTKRELKQYDNKDDNASTNFEFNVPECVSSNNESVIESNRIENGGPTISISVTNVTSVTNLATVESEEIETPATNPATVEPEEAETVQFPLPANESREQSPETSGNQTTLNQPVMFWTNGGLLGLEPSKPPDFGLPTGPIEEETKTDNPHKTTSNEDTLLNTSKSEDTINPSRIFEFSNRLLVNGFRRQISLVGNETLANSVKSDVPETTTTTTTTTTPTQKRYPKVTGIPFREQFGNRSPYISPSSPPLEHMRISFQPIDGFETSKLKLTFPDGSNNNNNNNNNGNESSGYGHMFPSFQLIPEPGMSIHDSGSGSDSDSDTFCRSSPYASEHGSESNSDQWDSDASPGMKDHELDDAFGRVSSTESASSSLVNGIRFPDIPNFDSMNDISNDPTPPPPPLPPMEWRGVKQDSSVTMEKQDGDGLSVALTNALNLTETVTVPRQQHKPAPVKEHHHFVEKVDFMPKPTQPEWQNLDVKKESSVKIVEEKEDFLQQIRRKSLNLRPISSPRPTTTPVGPTGVKVTAILEKANAIRQAVGSDDGEDNWSDT